jgi:hypothetical protein
MKGRRDEKVFLPENNSGVDNDPIISHTSAPAMGS